MFDVRSGDHRVGATRREPVHADEFVVSAGTGEE